MMKPVSALVADNTNCSARYIIALFRLDEKKNPFQYFKKFPVVDRFLLPNTISFTISLEA